MSTHTPLRHHPCGFSRLGRASVCPASVAEATRGTTRTGSAGATAGTLLHRALETGDRSGLSDYQVHLLEKYEELRDAKLEEIRMPVEESQKEFRREILDGEGNVVTFGTIDERFRFKRGVAVFDLKSHPTGRIDEVSAYWQLTAALAAEMQADDTIMAGVGIAIAPAGPTIYEIRLQRQALETVLSDIREIVANTQDPAAEYSPGYEQCRYCGGLATCEVAAEVRDRVAHEVQRTGVEFVPETEAYRIVDDATFSRLVDDAKAGKAQAESCLAWARDVLQTAESSTWELQASGSSRKIADPSFVLDTLPQDVRLAIMRKIGSKWGVSDLEAAIRETKGIRGKAVKEEVDALVGAHIQMSPRAPSIQRKKGAE